MNFEYKSLVLIEEALRRLDKGFSNLPASDIDYDVEALSNVISEVADRLQDNFPYFHPYYAGQMLKPPHPIARLAYMLSLWINPNNHALDGGRASSAMEKEAVAEIASMFGWTTFMGHLCGGGTMANLEALWVSRQLKPGARILASEQAHYTHQRISGVLGMEFEAVPCDSRARMDIGALRHILEKGGVGTVVATIGTTGTGSVDPLQEILKLKEKYGFRLHADAAYGGYFTLVDNLSAITKETYDCLSEVDSIVIDPHKHGLQPYGCGCVMFNDPRVGALYKHDSPYTYFSSSELHLGEISLECSRPGASAVALWATQRLLPLVHSGEFSESLSKSREAALSFYGKLLNDPRFKTVFEPELDIVIWAVAAKNTSEISDLSLRIFDVAALHNLHLATFNYPSACLKGIWNDVDFDRDSVTCLRSCLMKPEHEDWLDRIWAILDEVTNEVTRNY
ncbi:MAG: aspartate aminotransferase family protein [Chloroflexi bacterium]|nr:aspartate aminotransferase family protein [Chloroflexota bacterium]